MTTIRRTFTAAETELNRTAIAEECKDTVYALTPTGLRTVKIMLRKARGEMLMPYEENVLKLLEVDSNV